MIESFKEYGRGVAPRSRTHHSKPWLLFHSEVEFFAELVLDSSLPGSQVGHLIKMASQICDGEPFMLRNHRELKALGERASHTLLISVS